MPRRTSSAVTPRACSGMVLVILAWPRVARGNDVSDELTVGALSSSAHPGASPYVSDRLGGALDASEQLSLSLDGTFTRYLKANHVPAENIFQIAAAADYAPNDNWAFGVDVRGSPPSTAVTRTATETVRSRTSLVAAGLSAEYDSAGNGPFETVTEGYAGVASYSTNQRARSAAKGTPSRLTQFRLSPAVTEVLWQNTEAELSGSYYAYSTDPLGTGYFGTSVFGRESLGEGLPLEPLRWSFRPTVRQRLGPVKLSGFFQYGRYVGDAGFNAIFGLKVQVKASGEWKLWASFSFQRDVESTGETLSIPWGAIGARVSF